MKCILYRKYLIPYAEGTLPDRLRRRVEAHLSCCWSCTRELRELAQMANALREAEYPAVKPASDLRSRVMSRISCEPVRRSWWTMRVQAYSAAAAALLLFAAVLITVEPPLPRSVKQPQPGASVRSPAMERQETPAKMPSTGDQVAELRKDVAVVGKPRDIEGKQETAADDASVRQGAEKAAGAPSLTGSAIDSAGRQATYGEDISGQVTATPKPPGHPRDARQSYRGETEIGPAGPAEPPELLDAYKTPAEGEEARVTGNLARDTRSKDSLHDENTLALEKKLKESPNSREVLLELLDAYRKAGRAEDEHAIAERLTKLDADNAQYWLDRAQAAERAKMPQTAVFAYRNAISLGLKGKDLELAQSRLSTLEPDAER